MLPKRQKGGSGKDVEDQERGKDVEDMDGATWISAPDPDSILPGGEGGARGEEADAGGTRRPKRTVIAAAPLDCDEMARAERDSIDYGIKITAEMAQDGLAPRRVRVYADGIYDLFHQGHARQLMQAKNAFPLSDVYLMVGVCNDALTRANKGKTVMNENERYEALRHCRYVDEVIRDAPWTLDESFLSLHKIDFVAHDDEPYTIGSSGADIYDDLKKKGMFVATKRTSNVSTSDVVARIVRDYDEYVRRNLERGYTRKELNVSFLRGQKINLESKVEEIKNMIIQKMEEKSKDVISSFTRMFAGGFEHMITQGRHHLSRALSPPKEMDVVGKDDDSSSDGVGAAHSSSSSSSSSSSRRSSSSLDRQLKRRTNGDADPVVGEGPSKRPTLR